MHMLFDPKDYINPATHNLDLLRVGSAMTSAVALAHTDPTAGLGSAIGTSLALRELMSPTSAVFRTQALTAIDAALTLSSLGLLRVPYDSLGGLHLADPYKGTLSSLAAVAGVAEGLRSTYASVGIAGSVAATSMPPYAAALRADTLATFASAKTVASTYIASAASVYGLESTLVRAAGAGAVSSAFASSPALVGISAGSLARLHAGITDLSIAAQRTWEGVFSNSAALRIFEPPVLRSPAVELYTAVHAAAAVSFEPNTILATDDDVEDVLEGEFEGFDARLASLDHDLVDVYRGGVAAIESGSSDWQRHSMTSFRELTTHVLHRLAPDREVIASAAPEELDKGRPTRRARLGYIFAGVAGGEIAQFFRADMAAAVALFELLNSGTHKLGNRATREQVRYLEGHVVGLVSSMLRARGH